MNLPFIDSQNFKQKDYTNSILQKAEYDTCVFENCNFENSDLERSNFHSAYNFNINPSKNNIKKAIFSKENIIGLLKSEHIIIKS